MNSYQIMSAIGYALAGMVLAVAYLWLLRRTVTLIVAKGSAALVVPLCLLRLGIVIAAFWAIAQQGAGALLTLLAGFTLMRLLVQRIAEEE